MNPSDVAELHFICLIEKIPSILRLGILSHDLAQRLPRIATPPVDDPLVQHRRENKNVPGAGPLHRFANLYFHARNPMMCRIQDRREELTVLRISPSVLRMPGVIIADGNASSDYTAFYPAPDGLNRLDRDRVFARDWRVPGDKIEYWRRKSARCAEVLIPNKLPPTFIAGAYVSSAPAQNRLQVLAPTLPSRIDEDLFTIR